MISNKIKTLFECYRFHNLFKSNIKTKKWNKKEVQVGAKKIWSSLMRFTTWPTRIKFQTNSKFMNNSLYFFFHTKAEKEYLQPSTKWDKYIIFCSRKGREWKHKKSPWLNTKTRESIFWQYNYVYEIPVTIMIWSNKDPENETKHKILDLTPKHFTNLYELTVINDWDE